MIVRQKPFLPWYFYFVKRFGYLLVSILVIVILSITCSKKETLTICGTQCPPSTPWTVESLDSGLPCFASRDSCLKWANTHGYSDKPCVQCAYQ
ncbi:MAG: hypothetical protein KGO81_13410 [Bacteroidota bacterium]|nr:hypothetical protein [Bacteroidota bacterium]